MKKFLALLLSIVTIIGATLSFTSCGEVDDFQEIKEKGKFVCGITAYEPMNYYDDKGVLVGFDTELAKAVADYLGVDVEFKTIDWDSKYLELNSGKIDLIWNGFTYGYESDGTHRSEYVDFSSAYLRNEQCVVIAKEDAATLNNKNAFAGKKAAAEGGSSGVSHAITLSGIAEEDITLKSNQVDALLELKSGRVDFVVIDLQMAKAMVGKGDYSDLQIVEVSDYVIEPEVYAIGGIKGSTIIPEINKALKALYANGTIAKIAAKYDLQYDVIEIK